MGPEGREGGTENRRFSRRDSINCSELWTTSPHTETLWHGLKAQQSRRLSHPTPCTPSTRNNKTDFRAACADGSEAPFPQVQRKPAPHFHRALHPGLAEGLSVLPALSLAPGGRWYFRTTPEPQAQESQSARCAQRQDGCPSWGGRGGVLRPQALGVASWEAV